MATYEMRLAPDPSSPTGFSLQYVYVPSTPVERAQAQIGEIARGLGRQLGLTGRYIAEGTAGTVGIVTNPLAAMGAAATGDMQNFVPLQEQVSRGLTALGVPEPRGAVEQSVAGLSRAVAGAGGVAGAARAAIPVATGAVGRGTLTELAAMPGRQLAAGATGEGARQLAEAGGAGPIGQTLAAVGGGAIPFAGAPTTAASLVDDLSAAYRPGSVVRSGAGPVPPPPPRRPSPFDYVAVEAAARERNQLRPFETAEPLPAPATYDEAVQQVADLRAQLADADRNVRLSTSIQNPSRAGLRSLDQRAVLERQLAAAEGHLARLRPAAPERQNAPGTSEAARAILEKHGMGNLMTPGSTRRGPGGVSSFGAFELERMLTGKKGPEVVRDAGRVGYAGQAPGEAVEYLAAAAKGLPMDNASRMQRARDLGFNINRILYHGTKSREPLTEFKRRGSGRQGSFGVWFSDERDVANKYASADDRVGEFYVRGNLLDLTDFSPEGIEQLRKAWQYLQPSYGPEFQILADYTGAESAFDAFVNRVYGGDIWKQGNTLDFQNDLLDALASDVQGVVLADSMEGVPNRSFVVFDPANIRSVHAAFDPDAADSSNLLAGISGLAAPTAGLGAAGAMAAGGGQERERQPRTD